MARGLGRARTDTSQARQKAAATFRNNDAVPQEFREMLEEIEEDPPLIAPRPIKRRRVGDNTVVQSSSSQLDTHGLDALAHDPDDDMVLDVKSDLPVQTVEDYSEDSDEDEFEWEEVEIPGAKDAAESFAAKPKAQEDVMSIIIDEPDVSKMPARRRMRKPPTKTEKQMRLTAHKMHILCLLFQGHVRNHWCNDAALQRNLRRLIQIPANLIEKLSPSLVAIQMQRSRLFKDALMKLAETWRSVFTITLQGISRPSWENDKNNLQREQQETFMDLKDFRDHAQILNGSADYGAQLFCALLRGLGVETRLVYSLQPLPFASAAAVDPAKGPTIPTVYAVDSDDEKERTSIVETERTPSVPRRISRLGASRNRPQSSDILPATSQGPSIKKAIPRPRHPVFWVEAFDEAYQAWIPIDTMATGYVGKPLSLEPALNDPQNLLCYAIAYEEDGVAKDVTRRYTKAYNAKTRKMRVECTERGIEWFKKAMRVFGRRKKLDRDQFEDAAFIQRDISEGMPRNIEDFKGHPVYVLERHLYRDQVIHPKREAGKVGHNAKAADLSNLESVYRRQDVHNVKSAEKWFRLGRQLKADVEPLKHSKPRRLRELRDDLEVEEESSHGPMVGLYAQFQTEMYIPPPVQDGKIPKNAFRNIDVYVRSMIPAGAVQIKSLYARQAAKVLGIDFADAVTGFKFQGRHGTAIIDGVIVATTYRDAMLAVLEGLAYTRDLEVETERSARALAMWRRLVLGLRIIERVEAYKQEDEESAEDEDLIQREIDAEAKRYHDMADNNGLPSNLLLEGDDEIEVIESLHSLPTPGENSMQHPDPISDLFEEPQEGGFLRASSSSNVPRNNDGALKSEAGGGFLTDNHSLLLGEQLGTTNEAFGGGFIVEDINDISPRERFALSVDQSKHSCKLEELKIHDADADATDQEGEDNREEMNDSARHQIVQGSPANSEQSLFSHDPEDDEVDPDWLD